jgi:hypothetical protein
MYVGFEVPDGYCMGVMGKDFECHKGVVVRTESASLLLALLPRVLVYAWIFWSVRGFVCFDSRRIMTCISYLSKWCWWRCCR